MIKKKFSKGFSLIEVLVAITILLLVLANPMQILKRAGNSTQYSSEQVVAYFLAQEGMEIVQKRRDDLLLQYWRGQFGLVGTSITNPMSQMTVAEFVNCIGSSNRCALDARFVTNSSSVAPTCNGNNAINCSLYLASSGQSRYTHIATGNSATPYRRFVRIEPNPSSGVPDELKVTVSVEWRTGSLIAGQKVELVTYLSNIYATN